MQLVHFRRGSDFISKCTELLTRTLTAASPHPSAVVIPGGGTPSKVYQQFAATPIAAAPSSWIVCSDERYVARDDPDSNYLQAKPFLENSGVPHQQLIWPDTEPPLEEAARGFDSNLAKFFAGGGQLELAILGVGTDGHTASIFSEEAALDSEYCYARQVERPAPPHRITLTPYTLDRAKRVVFWVAGENKAVVVSQLLNDPDEIPAGLVVRACPRVEVWYTPENPSTE